MQMKDYRIEVLEYIEAEVMGADYNGDNMNDEELDGFNSTLNFIAVALIIKDGKINNLGALSAIKEVDYRKLGVYADNLYSELKNDRQFASEYEINFDALPAPSLITAIIASGFHENAIDMTPEGY
jgi:hypothetical protein